jgi:hypothetical protein
LSPFRLLIFPRWCTFDDLYRKRSTNFSITHNLPGPKEPGMEIVQFSEAAPDNDVTRRVSVQDICRALLPFANSTATVKDRVWSENPTLTSRVISGMEASTP